jgi:hypothetical protein
MVDDSSPSVTLRDIVIVGGGCYGSFYAGQLERARERGRVVYRTLLIVDRSADCQFAEELGDGPTRRLVVEEWDQFFDRYLQSAGSDGRHAGDTIVPSPLMPHLMYQWLLRRARIRWPGRSIATRSIDREPGTPYDTAAPDGTRYVSYADWLCPTHCIEPAVCPVIRAPRSWDIADALETLTHRLAGSRPTAGPVLFHCHHRVFGVGMFDVDAVVAGEAVMASAGASGQPIDVLVGTISHCHGAVNLLRMGAWDPRGTLGRSIFGEERHRQSS